MCGYHCKDIKASDLNVQQSINNCIYNNCTNKKLINGICSDHQSISFYNELINDGKTVCENWKRNCFNETNGFSKCYKCLEDDRDSEKKRKERIIEFNKNNKDNKQCIQCAKVSEVINFIYKNEIVTRCIECRIKNRVADMKYKATERCKILQRIREKSSKCIAVRKASQKLHPEWHKTSRKNAREKDLIGYLKKNAIIQKNRRANFPEKFYKDKMRYRTNPKYKYNICILSAKRKNNNFNLTYEQASEMFFGTCFYCGHVGTDQWLNGIDRMNNDIGYEINNCVSCCKTCNNIKCITEASNFIYIIHHILNNLKLINTDESYPCFFKNTSVVSFNSYKNRAEEKLLDFELSQYDFDELINEPCYICGKISSQTHKNGIDRVDNSKGYISNNIEPCCTGCNFMKKDLTFEDFINKLIDIYNNNQIFNSDILPKITKDNEIIDSINEEDEELLFNNTDDFDMYFDETEEEIGEEIKEIIHTLEEPKIKIVNKTKTELLKTKIESKLNFKLKTKINLINNHLDVKLI